ncbi:MAG: hypothetical protein M2R45_02451 [Verrucomicrobia subdivision 3 bacterium]|nr:hypothetical protein [Limisphaerales bacterium]MCS1413240.1 hypothetical protein [Limisphaerales bacterium]
MDFTKRPMFEFAFASGTDICSGLTYWIQLVLDYNPKAEMFAKRRAAPSKQSDNTKPAKPKAK